MKNTLAVLIAAILGGIAIVVLIKTRDRDNTKLDAINRENASATTEDEDKQESLSENPDNITPMAPPSVAWTGLVLAGRPKGDGIVKLNWITRRVEKEPSLKTTADMTLEDIYHLLSQSFPASMKTDGKSLLIRGFGWSAKEIFFSSTDSGIVLPRPPSFCKASISDEGILTVSWDNSDRLDEMGYLSILIDNQRLLYAQLLGKGQQQHNIDLSAEGIAPSQHNVKVYFSYMGNPLHAAIVKNSAPVIIGEVASQAWLKSRPQPKIFSLDE